MTFLTSILLGLAMGSGTVFSIRFGQKDRKALKECVLASFVLPFCGDRFSDGGDLCRDVRYLFI